MLAAVLISGSKAASQTLDLPEDIRLTLDQRETLLKDGALGLHGFPIPVLQTL